MSFPFLNEFNFNAGGTAEFTTESDTGAKLDVSHWRDLARRGYLPFNGAHAMLIHDLGDANRHTLNSTAVTQAANVVQFYRFMLYVPANLNATADDIFNIFELKSGSDAVVEVAVSLQIIAATGAIGIGIGETAASTFSTIATAGGAGTNKWYAIELRVDLDNAGANDGTIDLYVNGYTPTGISQIASLDQAAITSLVIGTINTLATTRGDLVFDNIVVDDLRIYPIVDRWPTTKLLTKSDHAFVGQGILENVSLISGAAADNTLTVYDTDRGNTLDYAKTAVYIANVVASSIDDVAGLPIQLQRGAYVVLGGTNPRAIVTIRPNNYSQSSLISSGQQAKRNVLEVF